MVQSRSPQRRVVGALLPALLVFSAALSLAACGDDEEKCDGQFCEGEQPNLTKSANSFDFSVIEIGGSADELLTLSNTGEGALSITGLEIRGTNADAFVVNTAPDTPYAGETFDLCSPELASEGGCEDSIDLQIVFTPTAVGSASAELVVRSNDPNEPTCVISLDSLEIGPVPQVTPNPIVFGQVPAGEMQTLPVTLTNVGSADLVVVGIELAGSPDFSPETITLDEPVIVPDDSRTFDLTYAPPTQSPDSGTLLVSYEFTGEPEPRVLEVPITANGNEPCIRVTPADEIDFGQSIIGRPAEQAVVIENCGSAALEVTSIALDEASATQFALAQLPEGIAGGLESIERGGSRTFVVTYTPVAEEPSTGNLVIESNAAGQPTLQVPIFGVGTFNNCPVAIAEGYVVPTFEEMIPNPEEFASTEFTAEPIRFVKLLGDESNDPDGDAITSYEWSIVQAPPGFSIPFVPSAKRSLAGDSGRAGRRLHLRAERHRREWPGGVHARSSERARPDGEGDCRRAHLADTSGRGRDRQHGLRPRPSHAERREQRRVVLTRAGPTATSLQALRTPTGASPSVRKMIRPSTATMSTGAGRSRSTSRSPPRPMARARTATIRRTRWACTSGICPISSHRPSMPPSGCTSRAAPIRQQSGRRRTRRTSASSSPPASSTSAVTSGTRARSSGPRPAVRPWRSTPCTVNSLDFGTFCATVCHTLIDRVLSMGVTHTDDAVRGR